jgi:hypothetical protein
MKAYLSSTFQDLKEHRRAAYDAMRGLRVDVIAMEDYVAREDRPLAECVRDVESCDLYVGVFAFRYGYVPPHDNPAGRSITELEYRTARAKGIPCLIFLVPDGESWPLKLVDDVTGDGEGGARVKALRTELSEAHTPAWFTTPQVLAAEVTKAVAQLGVTPGDPVQGGAVVPHPRQLSADLLILHTSGDVDTATDLSAELARFGRTARLHPLVAATPEALLALDEAVTHARSAAVLLSAAALTVFNEDRARAERALGLVRDRAGALLAVTTDEHSRADVDRWDLDTVVGPRGVIPSQGSVLPQLAFSLNAELAKRDGGAGGPIVGLPAVVVAMTESEAAALLSKPPEPVAAVIAAMGSPAEVMNRYGSSRWDWRPFADSDESIGAILADSVGRVNANPNRLRGRRVAIQRYGFEGVQDPDLFRLYQHISRSGCLVIIDELSLFHDDIRWMLEGSPLPSGPQVAFVTLAPRNPIVGSPDQLLEQELAARLEGAARRFDEGLDPLCELSIPERRRLARWLNGNLPRALDALRDAALDEDKVRSFAAELGMASEPGMGRLIAGEMGSL